MWAGGVKNAKNWGKMLSFGASTCKFPYKTAIFAHRAIRTNPLNSFSPTWFCNFPARRRKKEFVENTRNYSSGESWEKGLSERNLRQSERFFCDDLAIQGPQKPMTIPQTYGSLKVEPLLKPGGPYFGLISILHKSQIQSIYKSMQSNNC